MMRIRRFAQSDLSALRRLIHDTIDGSYTNVYPPRAVLFFKNFHSDEKILQRDRDGAVLLVEDKATLVGTGSILGNEILGVFVPPHLQGHGYGKAVMRELEQRARESGYRDAVLSVSLPSRRFYEGLGYDITADRSIDVGEGQRLDYWDAKKRLI
jgi:GNAT superfamily N-acetyltransferase